MFQVIRSDLTARLAPRNPLRHVWAKEARVSAAPPPAARRLRAS